MIKKEQLNEVEKKNKGRAVICSKYVEEQTGSDTPKKASFKVRFIRWLKELPLDERYLAVKVHAPGLAKHLQESLIQIQNDPSQQVKKDSFVSKRINIRQAKQIIDSIILISDGQDFFDSIAFDFTYVQHPDKFYQLLATTLPPLEKQMFQTEQYLIEPIELPQIISIINKCQSREELALALIDFCRAEIFLKFEEKRSINLEQEKTRKKELSMYWRNLSEQNKKRLLMLNKQDFGQLSNFLVDKKIQLSASDLERECTEMLQMQKNEFCNKIFKCKLRKSLTFYTDYHELIYKQWKTDLNKKKRKARNRKASNAQKPPTSVNIGSIIQINEKPAKRAHNKNDREHEKGQKKVETFIHKDKSKNTLSTTNLHVDKSMQKNISNMSNANGIAQGEKGPRVGGQSSSNLGGNGNKSLVNLGNNNSDKNGPKQILNNNNNQNKGQNSNNLLSIPQNVQGQPSAGQKKKRNRNKRKKSVSAESKQTNTTNHRFQKQQRKIEDDTPLSISLTLLDSASTLPCSLPCSHESLAPESPLQFKKQFAFPQIDFSAQIFSKLQNDIHEYSDLINEEANEFYERRVIAYERIQFMLGMWKIPIKLFGSCASGITIKNSDIDIAVDNSILNYFMHMPENTRLKGALEQLEQLFQQQPWVTALKLIKTAAIPLIKMKVDTSIQFMQMPGTELYQPYIEALNRSHLSSGEIHIDLTIETINKELQSNHLGVISTDHINNWLKSIKSLHPIVIIIKNYLTKTNLNITYEGGLNTYSMICMLVAFIKENKLEDEPRVVHVLQKILKFYVFQFDEKTTGIDLLNSKGIFYNKIKLTSAKSETSSDQLKTPTLEKAKSEHEFCQADLLIKDPLNNGKNMTKNCYSFPKIRELFHKIYKACFEDQIQRLKETFNEQFKEKWIQAETRNPEAETQNKEVAELLNECKLKLGNPFITLFE